jgi:uncharacterized membrane protein YbhN (UPF0104 family)
MRNIKIVLQLVIVVLVGWGISRSVQRGLADLAGQNASLGSLRWGWIALAGVFYGVGLFPMCWFWHGLLHRMGQQPRWLETIRAYYIGHLGKYVPGKVMVVVLRSGLIQSQRVDTTVAVVSVFVETLTSMATGAFLSAVVLLIWYEQNYLLQIVAIGLMTGTALATLPPILKRLIRFLKRKNSPEELDRVLTNIGWSTIARGWIASAIGWCFIALSLWATLKGIPLLMEVPLTVESFASLLSSSALAVVAGFVSLLPGGFLVREWVLDQLVAPTYGAAVAVIAAILLRLIWLVTELLLSIILYLLPVSGKKTGAGKSNRKSWTE